MAEITAQTIKQLREQSGAGMMDCKKALNENNGDFEAAVDWLRKKGLSAAAKKSGRVAAEGLVAIASGDNQAAIVEINSETDFVAKNDTFQKMALGIGKAALEAKGDVEAVKEVRCPESGKSVSEIITDNIGVIGENLVLRRASALDVSEGVVTHYIHNAIAPGLGKIGVIIALESSADKEGLAALGKQIAMHIAAAKPVALTQDEVDASLIEREKEIFSEQARASGKPDEIIEKMVAGRLRKFYEEVVLLDQAFVIDGKTKISEVLENAAKELGAPVNVKGYVRFALGEGIEKKEDNFAEEVAATAGV